MGNEKIDVKKLRELADAATPGEWHANHGSWNSNVCVEDRLVIQLAGRGDAAFIAAARSALPACLDEIERLRSLLAEVTHQRDCLLKETTDAF